MSKFPLSWNRAPLIMVRRDMVGLSIDGIIR